MSEDYFSNPITNPEFIAFEMLTEDQFMMFQDYLYKIQDGEEIDPEEIDGMIQFIKATELIVEEYRKVYTVLKAFNELV